jgi:hypothetical protein
MVHPNGRTPRGRWAVAALGVTASGVRRNEIDGIVNRDVMLFTACVDSIVTINFRCHDRGFARVRIFGDRLFALTMIECPRDGCCRC